MNQSILAIIFWAFNLNQNDQQLRLIDQMMLPMILQYQLVAVKMDHLLCPKCQQPYTTTNPPKLLLNCPHTLCFQCLQTQILCPIDHKRIQRRKYTLEAFQTNLELLNRIREQPTHPQKEHQDSTNNQPLQEAVLNQLPSKTEISKKTIEAGADRPADTHSIQQREVPQFETCLLHAKKADLICLQDHCLICANCGLFGQHRTHNLLPYQKFALTFGSLTEQCLAINQQLQERKNKTNHKLLQGRMQAELNLKRQQQTQRIGCFISQLQNTVRQIESELLKQLESVILRKRQEIKTRVNLSFLDEKVDEFAQTVEFLNNGISSIMNVRNIEQFVDYVDQNHSKSRIALQGEELVSDIDKIYRQLVQDIVTQTKSFNFSFNKPNITVFKEWVRFEDRPKNRVNDYHISSPQKQKLFNQEILISNSNQQEALNLNQNSLSPIVPVDSFQYTLDEHLMESYHSKIDLPLSQTLNPKEISLPKQRGPRPSLNYVKVTCSQGQNARKAAEDQLFDRGQGNSLSKSISSSHHTQKELLRAMNNDKLLNKRRKKLELPQKYSKIYEELQKDNLDILDLGGAYLGDATVSIIIELVPSRTRLKAVKLMNNKLSDDIIALLIQNCKKVGTLNLSYNHFTEKALQYIEHECHSMGYLENITLSHNKIVLRNVKDRIEALKKEGIKVSL